MKPGYVYEGGGAPLDACVQGNELSTFEAGKPDFFPASIPAPMAYYYMGEGGGYQLTDSVSGDTAAGSVLHDESHQLTPGTEDGLGPQPGAVHSGPNWQADEYFGSSIACGKIDDTIIQKDTLSLADVDYGSNGSWAWSVWFRHEAGVNFPDYQREQFFGHGNPVFPTTAFDQVHIQFERSGAIRTILYDQGDTTRFNKPCMAAFCGSTFEQMKANPHCFKYAPPAHYHRHSALAASIARTNPVSSLPASALAATLTTPHPPLPHTR